MKFALAVITSFIVFNGLPLASANEMLRPKSKADFVRFSRAEQMEVDYVPVEGSKVAWADYKALRRDFAELESKTPSEIDQWIIENFAYMSVHQLQLQGVRISEFKALQATYENTRKFIVPPGYHRAAVAPVKEGLIDIKGIGNNDVTRVKSYRAQFDNLIKANAPDLQAKLDALRTHDHSDGMMSLGEAMAEVSRQRAVQAGFDVFNSENQTSHQTIESYFIISLPVSILKTGTHSDPAAIYGRQSHVGRFGGLPIPDGIYSDEFGGRQRSLFSTAVDFGAVVITQPDLQKTFGDPSLLKTANAARADAQMSNAWKWGHEVASAFARESEHNYVHAREIVARHFDEMLSPLKDRLAEMPPVSMKVSYVRYLAQRLPLVDSKTAAILHGELMTTWLDDQVSKEVGEEIIARSGFEVAKDFIANLRNLPGHEKYDKTLDELVSSIYESIRHTGNMKLPGFLSIVPPHLAYKFASVVEEILTNGALSQTTAAARFYDLPEVDQSKILRKIFESNQHGNSKRALEALGAAIRDKPKLPGQLIQTVLELASETRGRLETTERLEVLFKSLRVSPYSQVDGEISTASLIKGLSFRSLVVEAFAASQLVARPAGSVIKLRSAFQKAQPEGLLIFMKMFLDKHKAGTGERYRFLSVMFGDSKFAWREDVRTSVWRYIEYDQDKRADAVQAILSLHDPKGSKAEIAQHRRALVPRICVDVFR